MTRKSSLAFSLISTVLLLSFATSAQAQSKLSDTGAWAADLTIGYRVVPNITYLVANGYEAKLDVYTWYGITDVNDLLDDSPNVKTYAVQWLSSLPNRAEVAKRVSPIHYVRAGLPPILTIHGDADPTVPYSHAVRLHDALNKAGLPNQLLTIPGGKHGGFTRDETMKIFTTVREFLTKHGIVK
jgi:acetyl esterase/lipase